MIAISETTCVFPMIANPISQVKAPGLFNAYFKKHGIDAVFVPLQVASTAYIDTLRTLMRIPNVGGALVSIPYKPLTVDAVDEVRPRAALAGACNVVFRDAAGRTIGDLIDGDGFVRAADRSLQLSGIPWNEVRALVVGCGGVGRAIIEAIARKGVPVITVYDQKPELAGQVRDRIGAAFPDTRIVLGEPSAREHDLIVNATPLGMSPGDPMPLSLDGVNSNSVVADCVMKVEITKLLAEARSRGCRLQMGKEMLIEQAPLYLDLVGLPGATADDFRMLVSHQFGR